MHPDPLSSVLWGLSFVLSAIALGVFSRHARAWPSLVALVSLDLLLSAGLFLVRDHYAWYFYLYWGGSVLQSGCRLWVLADALRSIPGASFIPERARLIIVSAALVMAVGAGVFAWTGDVGWVAHLPDHTQARVALRAVILYNRAVCFACLSLCVGVLAAVFLLGLGWDRTGARIACGLGLELAELAVRSALFAESSHAVRAAADLLDGFTHLFVFVIWILALLQETRPISPKVDFQ